MRGSLEAKGLPCRLNETRQLRRLEARRTGAHVQFHPVGEHEAHPGAACWEGRYREARWRLVCVRAGSQRIRAHMWYAIELCRDLGQRHTDFLQLADVDEAFQVRRSVVRSASCPKWGGQEPALDVVTHGTARHPSQLRQFFDPIAALVLVVLVHR